MEYSMDLKLLLKEHLGTSSLCTTAIRYKVEDLLDKDPISEGVQETYNKFMEEYVEHLDKLEENG